MTAKYSAGILLPKICALPPRRRQRHEDGILPFVEVLMGFLWGAIFMATLDIGEVHLWGGECDSAGIWLMRGQP